MQALAEVAHCPWKLPTYPSPKPTITLTSHLGQIDQAPTPGGGGVGGTLGIFG